MAFLLKPRTVLTARSLRQFLHPTGPIIRVPSSAIFWEADRKGGYGSKNKIKRKEVERMIKEGAQMIGPELVKFKEEMVERLRMDVNLLVLHGDYEVVWKFDSQTAVEDWVVTTDKDHNEGFSTAEFSISTNKTGIFRGGMNTQIPKDGIVTSAGYCNIRSPLRYKSFMRQIPYEWDRYTHLLMRIRGDGRPYQLLLGIDSYFDVQWNDIYIFPLFTRGGPYWQIAKIPFSKFFLSSKGRIQDKQESVISMLNKIRFFGVSLYDGWSGDFHLEIDYIALLHDANHQERFAYELYKVNPSVHS